MSEEIDVEGIMQRIRGTTSDNPDPETVEDVGPMREALALRRAVGEARDACDLYGSHGMPPTRFWIPRLLREFLVRTARYFLNWQVHWNGVAVRVFEEAVAVLERIERWVEERLVRMQGRLSALEQRQAAFEEVAGVPERLESRIDERLARMQGRLSALEQRQTEADHRRAIVWRGERRLHDAYFDFESHHRGTEAELRERQLVHVGSVEEILSVSPELLTNGGYVLDIGCGRGEILELLRGAGIAARGVDINTEMIRRCREKGLEVVEDDLFDHLEGLPAASLAGAISCQLVEHLPFPKIAGLLDVLSEKLRNGAPLLVETVNPENLLVSSQTFHLDPTHRTKILAATLADLLSACGFDIVAVRYLTPSPPERRLARVNDDGLSARVINTNFERLNDLLFGPRDYAILARKRSARSEVDTSPR